MHGQLHVIVSTMRSGSSLCGHLLAEAGWIQYAGETHSKLHSEEGFEKAITSVKEFCQTQAPSSAEAPLCDKAVGPWVFPDQGRYLAERGDRIYLLLRHPLAIWRSQKQTGWSVCTLENLAEQLRTMRCLVELTSPEKLRVLTYYELSSEVERERLFGQPLNSFSTTSNTGKPGKGDPGNLIRSGAIREWSLEQDIERSLPEVWLDLEDPQFMRAMEEFHKILELTGREELHVDWEEDDFFFTSDILRIGGMEWEKGVASISVKELKKLRELPCRDGAFSLIYSEDLIHRCPPDLLVTILTEFKRILSKDGVLRFSSINLDFVAHLSLGKEPEYEKWYRDSFLEGGGEIDSAIEVSNHLTRNWGHCFFYNQRSLEKILERVGFQGVCEGTPHSGRAGKMPECLYVKERFFLEAKAPAQESMSELIQLDNLQVLLFTNGDPDYLMLQDNLLESMRRVEVSMEMIKVEITTGESGIYGTKEFNQTVYKKLDLVLSYLQEGKTVFFADVDIVFLKNPLPILISFFEADVDAVFQSSGRKHSSRVNTGFFMVRPTKEAIALFDVSNWRPENKCLSEINDQEYINLKLESEFVRRFVYKTLPLGQFPTGNVWFESRADAAPTMVHYNYMKGVKKKIDRMKTYNHWFVG